MPLLYVVQHDITKMQVDAIVNAANPTLLGGGGDGCIHRAAGPALRAACQALGGCQTGEAKITAGYRLPCRYVIQTVGPIWQDGAHSEADALASCYRASLTLASSHDCATVAFPLIASGAYGFPVEQAFAVARSAICGFLADHELTVYLVFFNRTSSFLDSSLRHDVTAYVEDRSETMRRAESAARRDKQCKAAFPKAEPCQSAPVLLQAERGLTDYLDDADESFSQMLLRLIDHRGMTDAQCYKKATIDRKLFSKIRGDKSYRPSKTTAVAFAVALELSLPETEAFLRTAGFALSKSNKFDRIITYFLLQGVYDVFTINEALFEFDQSLLGA